MVRRRRGQAISAVAEAEVKNGEEGVEVMPAKELLLVKLGQSARAITSGSKAERIAVSELLPLVEKENPTVAPASSELLEGNWQFRYCGSPAPGPLASPTREIALLLYAGGYSPGLFGYEIASKLPSSLVDVSSITLKVRPTQPRAIVKAELSVLGNKQTITIREELDAQSESRLSERYVEVKSSVVRRKFKLPTPLRYSRSLFITYLDEDLLVVRDESNNPEILTRIVASSSGSTTTDEEAADEEAAEATTTTTTTTEEPNAAPADAVVVDPIDDSAVQ